MMLNVQYNNIKIEHCMYVSLSSVPSLFLAVRCSPCESSFEILLCIICDYGYYYRIRRNFVIKLCVTEFTCICDLLQRQYTITSCSKWTLVVSIRQKSWLGLLPDHKFSNIKCAMCNVVIQPSWFIPIPQLWIFSFLFFKNNKVNTKHCIQ